jgi:flagellar basal body-associated protein FliL
MGRSLVVALLAVIGLLCAAGMGYAAYVVSRGSVAVPVTQLEQAPADQLTPAVVRERARPKNRSPVTTTTRTVAPPPPPPPTTTVDDHGGGSGNSGHGGGGGHGGDD